MENRFLVQFHELKLSQAFTNGQAEASDENALPKTEIKTWKLTKIFCEWLYLARMRVVLGAHKSQPVKRVQRVNAGKKVVNCGLGYAFKFGFVSPLLDAASFSQQRYGFSFYTRKSSCVSQRCALDYLIKPLIMSGKLHTNGQVRSALY